MFQKLFFICAFLITTPFLAFSTIIEGFEPDYAERTIQFYTYTDPITKGHKDLFSIHINETGEFSQEVSIKETTVCYADFDVYSGMLILEPSKKIKIQLPILTVKSFANQKNPYFKPMKLWIRVETEDKLETNKVCNNFEKRFNDLTDKYFNQLYFRQSKVILDSVSNTLRNEFKDVDGAFNKNLINFKLKILEGEVTRKNQEKLLEGVNISTFSYFNPGFIDLMDRVFTNKLFFETNNIKGNNIQKIVNQGDILALKAYVKEKYAFQNGVDEFMILKFLHDAYYSGKFSKKAIVSILKSDFYTKNKDPQLQNFSKSIHQKITYLIPGSLAPEICLPDMDKANKCTSEGEKYKYIMFVDMEIQVCREHLKYLPVIAEKHKEKLDVFVIIKDPYSDKIKEYMQKNNIQANFLFDSDIENFSKKYKIKSYPTCFLLNKKHFIEMNPAKAPLDGFENQFSGFLKKEYFEQLK